MWKFEFRFGLIISISFGIIMMSMGQSNETPNMSIVILRDVHQTDLNEKLSKAFSEVSNSHEITIEVNYVNVDRKRLDESLVKVCSHLSSGVSLIIDITLDLAWPNLTHFLRASNVPYIHVNLSIGPLVRAYFKFIEYVDIQDVVMIFSSEEERIEGMHEAINHFSIRTVIFNGLNETIVEQIIKLRPISPHFVIFARPSEMVGLLEKAKKYNAIERSNRWHLFYTDFEDENAIQNHIMKNPELRSFSLSSTMCCVYLGQLLTDKCICHGQITFSDVFIHDLIDILMSLLSVDNFKTYSLDCVTLNELSDLSSLQTNPTVFETQLAQLIARFPSIQFSDSSPFKLEYYLNVMVFGRDRNDLQLAMDESAVPLELATIGNSVVNVMLNESLKSQRRFFRIGVIQVIPWSYLKPNPKTSTPMLDEDGNALWEGFCIDFVQHLSEILQFDYELVVPKNGSIGNLVAGTKHTWDGLVGDLVTGEIDIAVAPMIMTADREEVIDFVEPTFGQTGISIVIRKAVRQTSLFKMLTVLRVEVWFSIVGIIITAAILLCLLEKYSPYSAKNNPTAHLDIHREFSFTESLWFALTSFLPQGGGEPPKSLSSRILVAAFWLFVVLMLATFEANLAAFLSVESMQQTSISNLEQLAKQSRINYTVVNGSDAHKYFINMKMAEDTLHRMWMELVLNSSTDETSYRVWGYPIKEQYGEILQAIDLSIPVINASEGFKMVLAHLNADFAFIHDVSEIKYEISQSCDLIEVGEVFAEQPYAVAIQQGSQLEIELSLAILELQKSRVFETLTSKYWSANEAKCSSGDDHEVITLESLGGVFILTLIGLALAMVTLIIELIYQRHISDDENNVRPISNHNSTPPPSYPEH